MVEKALNYEEYEIIDTLKVTLADSFLINKIGSGHGEKKLYVGNESEVLKHFFSDFKGECFFMKRDFRKFLNEAKSEYENPKQEYKKKSEMIKYYNNLVEKNESFYEDKLCFSIYRVNVEPPRMYINSNSEYYNFMREIGLPNLSYLSIMKLKNKLGTIEFYFRIFFEYIAEIEQSISRIEEEKINDNNSITSQVKLNIVASRVGQGSYRRKLLEECSVCPFTKVNDERMLIASHIKPWKDSNDKEKIDPKNGFVFTPTYDRLFDQGFITFDDDKRLEVSPWLSPMNQKRLGIYTGKHMEILPLDEKRKGYLAYHRKNVFKA